MKQNTRENKIQREIPEQSASLQTSKWHENNKLTPKSDGRKTIEFNTQTGQNQEPGEHMKTWIPSMDSTRDMTIAAFGLFDKLR